MSVEVPNRVQDWPTEKRVAIVLSILSGQISSQEAARIHGVDLAKVEEWRQTFLAAGGNALDSRATDDALPNATMDVSQSLDVGVWVCAPPEQPLAPYLFMQTVCPGSFPLESSAIWVRGDRPPKPFRKSKTVALLHGECGPLPDLQNHLHLFSVKATETAPVERETALSDWQVPVPVLAVLVFLERREEPAISPRLSSLFRPRAHRTLAWAKAQGRPLVIAEMGNLGRGSSEAVHRRDYDLVCDVSIVSGPLPARCLCSRADVRGPATSGVGAVFSRLLDRGELCFDSVYAMQILDALSRQFNRVSRI